MTKPKASRGADDEYVDLLSQHRERLFRLILCMVRNSSDAEDIFQQVAITMWDKFSTFERNSDFFAWACTITRYKVREFVRAKARFKTYFSDEVVDKLVATERDMGEALRLQSLTECRQKLPAADQELLAACYDGGASVVALAEESGRTVRSLYNSLWRIRRTLYDCIKRTMTRQGYA